MEPRAASVAIRLVTRAVDDLSPHPSYVRHNLATPLIKLAALAEQGDSAFLHPISITQNNWLIDGYTRWELAKRQGRPTLKCLEYCLTRCYANPALEHVL